MSNEEEELYQALSIFAENTNISEVIDITSVLAKYDDSVKEILADKQIVSRILKYSLNEFMKMDIEEIISCMDEPYISSVRMEPGHTKMEKVKKTAEEDSVPGEGKVYFDIRFNVYLKNEMIKILINIEALEEYITIKAGVSSGQQDYLLSWKNDIVTEGCGIYQIII